MNVLHLNVTQVKVRINLLAQKILEVPKINVLYIITDSFVCCIMEPVHIVMFIICFESNINNLKYLMGCWRILHH